MTREQFALVVNSDEKWVENSARLLGRRLKYSQREARWMGLVRLFSHEVGLPLKRSAELADVAIRQPEATRNFQVVLDAPAIVALVVDLARFHSARNAALSAALTLATPRKRGRPGGNFNEGALVVRERATAGTAWDALACATGYGVDVGALRSGLNESPAVRLQRLEDNLRFIQEMRASTFAAIRSRNRERTL